MKQIFHTEDYDQFNLYDMGINRPISRSMVNKLKKSIQGSNNLDCHPIVVDIDLNVLDGQHRLQAAKELGTTIYYVISERGKEIIPTVNSVQKQWGPLNYIEHYAARGDENYIWLRDFMKETELNFTILSQAFAHGPDRKELKEIIRAGEFKKLYFYTEKVERFLNFYLEILDMARAWKKTWPLGHTFNRGFCWALKCMFYTKKFRKNLFLRHYSYMHKMVVGNIIDKKTLASLIEIYNHKLYEHNRLTYEECILAQKEF